MNPDNSAITYYVDPQALPKHGTLNFNPDGSFVYTPNSHFAGVDQFLYYVSDGISSSNESAVVISAGGNIKVPPDFSSTETPDPSTFPNDLRGLWNSYLASKSKLGNVLQAMADEGGQVQGLTSGNPTNSQLDTAVAGLEKIYRAYDAYVTQVAATIHAASTFMRSVWITTQAKADVLNAINALPLTIAGLSPNKNELSRYQSALNDFSDGASLMVDHNGEVVQIAETTHEVAERSIQVLSAVTIAGAALDLLATKTLSECAKIAATRIIETYAEVLVFNEAAQQAKRLADWLGVPADKVQIFMDSLQLLMLVKAKLDQDAAAASNCFVAGTEVITAKQSDGSFSQMPIQDIQVADKVLTRSQYDPNGPLQEEKVLALYQHTAYALEDVTIQDASGADETIDVTPEHPFYVVGVGWTGSSQLTAGERLSQPDGSEATVVSAIADPRPAGVTVYNFEVDQDHTYFVNQGAGAVWVHNSCDSEKLGNNLGNRAQNVANGYEAHHIVAVNEPRAAVAQEILAKYKIDINSAENGVWLPGSQHASIHTDEYYGEVDEILLKAQGSKASVLAALKKLSFEIASGSFP